MKTFIQKSGGRIVITDGLESIAINPRNYDIVLDEDGLWMSKSGDIDKGANNFMPIKKVFQHTDIDWANSDPAPDVIPTNNTQAFEQLLSGFFLT